MEKDAKIILIFMLCFISFLFLFWIVTAILDNNRLIKTEIENYKNECPYKIVCRCDFNLVPKVGYILFSSPFMFYDSKKKRKEKK